MRIHAHRRAAVSILLVAVVILSGTGAVVVVSWWTSAAATSSYRGVVRNYYVAADEVEWNYTPSGIDEISGEPFGVSNPGQLQYTSDNGTFLGTSFLKCIYRQYTDANFTTQVPQPPWLGIMGPTLYAAVGDTIQITFKNECRFPENMHPHGVFYNRTSEGAVYNSSSPYYNGEEVPPGGTWVYDWMVPARAGPGPNDGTAVMWMYHSHVYEPVDVNDGLIGTIIISADGYANPDGTPKGFGMVIPLLFNVFDESQSQYESYNVYHNIRNESLVNASGLAGCMGLGVDETCVADANWSTWAESMRKYTINGYLYGNLPMITIPEGTEVLWCLMGMGGDFHSPAWDGNDLFVGGMSEDVVPLVPAEMVDGTMWANNTGTWLIESLTQEDLNGGMTARYTVVPSVTSPSVVAGEIPARSLAPHSGAVPAQPSIPTSMAAKERTRSIVA